MKNFRFGATTIRYELVNEENMNGYFVVQDVLSYLGKDVTQAIVIDDIYTEYASRRQGHALNAINEFVKRVDSKTPIIAIAAAMTFDFPTKPTEEQTFDEVEHKSEFLKILGFIGINKIIGYEFKNPFIYPTDIAKPVINEVLKITQKELSDKHLVESGRN